MAGFGSFADVFEIFLRAVERFDYWIVTRVGPTYFKKLMFGSGFFLRYEFFLDLIVFNLADGSGCAHVPALVADPVLDVVFGWEVEFVAVVLFGEGGEGVGFGLELGLGGFCMAQGVVVGFH